MATFARLHKHALDAEAAFTAEMVRLFGAQACNRRYDARRIDWDKCARVAGNLKNIADARARIAWQDSRNAAALEWISARLGEQA
jgi:hypothetical protein